MRIPKQQLQCPFCPTISTRGTGLASHVRTRHANQYRKWNRNPNRLLDAAKAGAPTNEKPEKKTHRVHRVAVPAALPPPADVSPEVVQQQAVLMTAAEPQAAEADGNETMALLQRAHDQLTTRQQTIDASIARIDALRDRARSCYGAACRARSGDVRVQESVGRQVPTDEARRAKYQGTVILSLLIDSAGRVKKRACGETARVQARPESPRRSLLRKLVQPTPVSSTQISTMPSSAECSCQ